MKIGDLVTLRWGEGKRAAGMVVADDDLRGEVYVEWFSEWTSTTWVRAADLELVNENR